MVALLEDTGLMVRTPQLSGLKRLSAITALALLIVTPAQTYAQPTIAESLTIMRERDQILLDIGWKLITANAAFCENTQPAIGLMFLDTGSFANPQEINQALGISGNILVQAVAKGSPAAEAGITALMPIVAIEDELTAHAEAARESSWQYLAKLNRRLSKSLQSDGSVNLYYRSKSGLPLTSRLAGVPACTASMELRDGEDRARADGTRVLIGSNFPGFTYPEEEFAAAIAHELAHIVLGHSAWLDGAGRARRNIRITEREADRLAPWLLANAGYDPNAAEHFMRRWGPDHGGGLFRRRTHAGWDERANLIAAEAALVIAAMEVHEGGAADWQRHFVRDVAN